MTKSSFGKVIPGLSVRSKELQKRVQNGSLRPSTDGLVFSADRELAAIGNMSRADLARSYVRDAARQKELNDELRDVQVKSQKAIDEQIKKDREELAERRRKEAEGK